MDLGISGKLALVCAASKGIGRAAAFSLAKEGVNLVLTARDAAALEETASDISRKTDATVLCFPADLTSRSDRARLAAAHSNIDILIANPGTPQRFADFQTMTREEREWWMEAHFYSMIELIQASTAGMVQRKFGRIVNVSVNFIKFPQAHAGHSHAARLALAGAASALAKELAPHNVTINSVLPGPINTEALRGALQRRAAAQGVSYEQVASGVLKNCPAGRFSEPEETGDLIAMLCAAQMGFVTGQNITNDGGAYPGLF